MKRVDTLLKRARQLAPNVFPCVSLLKQEGDKFVLSCDLWDGNPGKGTRRIIDTTHDTVEEAREAYNDFLKQYPATRKWNPVLLDMVLLTEGGEEDEEAVASGYTKSGEGGTCEGDERDS